MHEYLQYFLKPDAFAGVVMGFGLGWIWTSRRYILPSIIYNVSPETTVFAFDLHGVLVNPHFSAIIHIVWQKLFKWQMLILIINPIVWYYLIKVFFGSVIPEETVDKLCQRNSKFFYLKSIIIELMSAQRLNTKNIEFIKTLRKAGYNVYVMSNIWPSSLEKLLHKFPIIDELVLGFYIPAYEKGIHYYKPQKEFYESFKRFLSTKEMGKKHIIFIDNSLKNIKAANNAGLYGILVKSLDDLITQFKNNHS